MFNNISTVCLFSSSSVYILASSIKNAIFYTNVAFLEEKICSDNKREKTNEKQPASI